MSKEITELRHQLHRYPEISNKEFRTSERITGYIRSLSPDEILEFSKTGKAFVFSGPVPGKTTMFRAELDALPITENSGVPHVSSNPGVSHACGHDGHMAILAGLARKIAGHRPKKGRAVLLFQPAEETEQGAREVVNDPRFREIEPDYIFALHNVPGFEMHKVLLKTGCFAAASQGWTVRLYGKTSHAAEPENGISPADAISRIIKHLHELRNNRRLFKDLTLLTIIHIVMGEISFGTSPGYGEIRITLRAFDDEDMKLLAQRTEIICSGIAKEEKLGCEISRGEVFPALINEPGCVKFVEQAAASAGPSVEYLDHPFRWSEDFAYFTQKYKGCLFGLGAGLNQPQLHNPDYDFPDELITTGINLFYNIYKSTNT